MIECRAYAPAEAAVWDACVRDSRNGTFLFERAFMDYHADRFIDASLMFARKGKTIAVLPLSQHGNEWRSHGGLTYGGLLLTDRVTALDAMDMYRLAEMRARDAGVERVQMKPVPHIYHRAPCEEELFALHRVGARRTACGVDSVIALARPGPQSEMRRRAIRKARKQDLIVDRACPVADLHAILASNLRQRHDVEPVHSAQEMALLQSRFPANIACWGARDVSGTLLAGLWLFDTGRCVHTQYIASTPEGRERNGVDFLLAEAVDAAAARAAYFSFGTSTDAKGEYGLNEGLLKQKMSFGAGAIACDTYDWTLPQKDAS